MAYKLYSRIFFRDGMFIDANVLNVLDKGIDEVDNRLLDLLNKINENADAIDTLGTVIAGLDTSAASYSAGDISYNSYLDSSFNTVEDVLRYLEDAVRSTTGVLDHPFKALSQSEYDDLIAYNTVDSDVFYAVIIPDGCMFYMGEDYLGQISSITGDGSTFKISTDADNIITFGSDGGIYATIDGLNFPISDDEDNILSYGSDGKLFISATDIIGGDYVEKEYGKGLSSFDFTKELRDKLMALGQVDWDQNNPAALNYIWHKPTKLSQFENDLNYLTYDGLGDAIDEYITNNNIGEVSQSDIAYAIQQYFINNPVSGGSDNNFSDYYKRKLDSIEEGAQKNVNVTIPTALSSFANDLDYPIVISKSDYEHKKTNSLLLNNQYYIVYDTPNNIVSIYYGKNFIQDLAGGGGKGNTIVYSEQEYNAALAAGKIIEDVDYIVYRIPIQPFYSGEVSGNTFSKDIVKTFYPNNLYTFNRTLNKYIPFSEAAADVKVNGLLTVHGSMYRAPYNLAAELMSGRTVTNLKNGDTLYGLYEFKNGIPPAEHDLYKGSRYICSFDGGTGDIVLDLSKDLGNILRYGTDNKLYADAFIRTLDPNPYSTEDFNDFTISGLYQINETGLANRPDDELGILFVVGTENDKLQFFISHNDGKMYYRNYKKDSKGVETWSKWELVKTGVQQQQPQGLTPSQVNDIINNYIINNNIPTTVYDDTAIINRINKLEGNKYYTINDINNIIGDYLRINNITGFRGVPTDNNFTNYYKNLLDNINPGGEPNVQANWKETDNTSDAYIWNKPEKLSDFQNDSNFVSIEEVKKTVIDIVNNSGNIEINVETIKPDWLVESNTDPNYIWNKPTKLSQFINDMNYININDLKNEVIAYVSTLNIESDENFTKDLKLGLESILNDIDSYKNVQSDWTVNDITDPRYIWYKPEIPDDNILLKNGANYITEKEIPYLVEDYLNQIGIGSNASPQVPGGLTSAERTKLATLTPHVQADWNDLNASSGAYIKNKPKYVSAFINDRGYVNDDRVRALIDNAIEHIDLGKNITECNFTEYFRDKLVGIAAGAEVNVQADWLETNDRADDYIKHKPTKLSQFNNDLGYLNEKEVSQIAKKIAYDIALTQSDWEQNNPLDASFIQNKPDIGLMITDALANADFVRPDSLFESIKSYVSSLNLELTPDLIKKLKDIEEGAERNVQGDWLEFNTASDAYIKNKPKIPTNNLELINGANYLVKADMPNIILEYLRSLGIIIGTDGTITFPPGSSISLDENQMNEYIQMYLMRNNIESITVDDEVTRSSLNPVSSAGIYRFVNKRINEVLGQVLYGVS